MLKTSFHYWTSLMSQLKKLTRTDSDGIIKFDRDNKTRYNKFNFNINA